MESKPSTSKSEYSQRVYTLVSRIPRGRVMTYGVISSHIGPPEGTDIYAYERIGPRWVGYAMRSCPDDVPWHRVVNAEGRISVRPGLGPHLQKSLMEDEGIVFDQTGRIDLDSFGWVPDGSVS